MKSYWVSFQQCAASATMFQRNSTIFDMQSSPCSLHFAPFSKNVKLINALHKEKKQKTKKRFTLTAVMNQLKPLIGYTQHKKGGGKSHSEMCFKDIGVDCRVRNDGMQPSRSLFFRLPNPHYTKAEQFGSNGSPALLQTHILHSVW